MVAALYLPRVKYLRGLLLIAFVIGCSTQVDSKRYGGASRSSYDLVIDLSWRSMWSGGLAVWYSWPTVLNEH